MGWFDKVKEAANGVKEAVIGAPTADGTLQGAPTEVLEDKVQEEAKDHVYNKESGGQDHPQNMQHVLGVNGSSDLSKPLDSYVLSNRYQTNQVPVQMHELLSDDVKESTYFVQAETFAQNPSVYLEEMRQYDNVVIMNNYMGVGKADSLDSIEGKVHAGHDASHSALEVTLQAAQTLGVEVKDVQLTIGDSKNSEVTMATKEKLEAESSVILQKYGVFEEGKVPEDFISFGADEAATVAFAKEQGTKSVYIEYANPDQKHRYEGQKTTKDTVEEAVDRMGYTQAADAESADIVLYVNGASPDAEKLIESGYKYSDNPELKEFHQAFTDRVDNLPDHIKEKTAYVDLTVPNGAYGLQTTPKSDNLLAVGSWGTATNATAQTLASAAILQDHGDKDITKQFLEQNLVQDFGIQNYELQRDSKIDFTESRDYGTGKPQSVNSAGVSVSEFGDRVEILNEEVTSRLSEHTGNDLSDNVIGGSNPRTFEMFVANENPLPPFQEAFDNMAYNQTLADQAPELFEPNEIIRNGKQPRNHEQNVTTEVVSQDATAPSTPVQEPGTLSRAANEGVYSAEVEEMQEKLVLAGKLEPGQADGYFGDITSRALAELQQETFDSQPYSLEGMVADKATLNALDDRANEAVLAKAGNPMQDHSETISFNEDELSTNATLPVAKSSGQGIVNA